MVLRYAMIILCIGLLIGSVVGCQSSSVNTQADVNSQVVNVSRDVDDVSALLQEIDDDLN